MSTASRPKMSQPCPCGSGKKYKHCCFLKQEARRKATRRVRKVAIWTGALVVAAAIVYGMSQTAGVAYDDADIGVVDFSGLDASQKRAALRDANAARCPCGCRMSVAQCVAIDPNCPLRPQHVDEIRTMVEDHRPPPSSS